MQCPRCYFDNAADSRVCEYCGAPLSPSEAAPVVSPSARKRRTQLGTGPDQEAWTRSPRPAPPRIDPDDPFRVAAQGVRAARSPAPSPEPQPAPEPVIPEPEPTAPAPPARSRRSTLLDEDRPRIEAGEVGGVLLVFSGSEAPRSVILRQGRTTLGRDARCDVVVGDPRVSGSHLILRLEGEDSWVLDTSSNGTWLAGRRLVNDKAQLRDGAVLTLGDTRLVVKLLAGDTLALLREPVR